MAATAPLWPIRDDRTLSEHAKIAYLMLWLRGQDIHPSMRTLARDMSVSATTATRAIRELQDAGLVKVLPRVTELGDPDSNQFILTPPREAGYPRSPGEGGVGRVATPKNGSGSKKVKGEDSQASRRARPAVTRDEMIATVRRSVMLSYDPADEQDLLDGQAVALWYLLVGSRQPADPVKYLCKIFRETPYLDTHLANAGTEEDWS